MTSRRSSRSGTVSVARRSLEILQQMTAQLIASRTWAPGETERLERLKADLARLVHWALHDQGKPEIVARIRDCYCRCQLDLADTAVLRRVRGAVKGELRKAGIDTAVPGCAPELDDTTIILTTKRTIQKMGGASSSLTEPGPALAPKPAKTAPEAPAEPYRLTPAELRCAFDTALAQALAAVRRSGRSVAAADYLAAIYNDEANKRRFIEQVAAALPPSADRQELASVVDGFFRDGFKASYIERTDRQGNRRAHRR